MWRSNYCKLKLWKSQLVANVGNTYLCTKYELNAFRKGNTQCQVTKIQTETKVDMHPSSGHHLCQHRNIGLAITYGKWLTKTIWFSGATICLLFQSYMCTCEAVSNCRPLRRRTLLSVPQHKHDYQSQSSLDPDVHNGTAAAYVKWPHRFSWFPLKTKVTSIGL